VGCREGGGGGGWGGGVVRVTWVAGREGRVGGGMVIGEGGRGGGGGGGWYWGGCGDAKPQNKQRKKNERRPAHNYPYHILHIKRGDGIDGLERVGRG